MKKELARTHEKLCANTLDEESFRDNDEKVCFFTGIPKYVGSSSGAAYIPVSYTHLTLPTILLV